ncbi:gamma-glutamyltransferase family protein [Pseudooceanicola sp. MF1-13]|uniref:gamma-glutamyltransferase family protein n=1 Tax=Pseudooceanicola sp. MF1-13 TaxID=3379095 RepID=UPI003891236A
MSGFTTRPEILGTFGTATSTHWIASAVGMKLLEDGGTAVDAAAAMWLVHCVVEPHLCGPLGDMTAMLRVAGEDAPHVVCGQGVAPAAATIDHYRDQGLDLIPGSGLLSTVVPGTFGAWILMLRDHGRLSIRDIFAPAIHYARHGHPVLERVSVTIDGLSDFFRDEWPTSAETWLPGGCAPAAESLFRNPALADALDRIVTEAEAAGPREQQVEAARRAIYEGFVAEAIDTWVRKACVMDASGQRNSGVLTGADMAAWSATYEPPLATDYHGWTVWKADTWAQSPVLLQSLNVLAGADIGQMDLNGADFVHTVTETMKLCFADREAYYGDPADTQIPVLQLLSADYAAARRGQIGPDASHDQRPGHIVGYEAWRDAALARSGMKIADAGVGAGEPTMAHLTEKRGDTVHIDVIDQWGNVLSATPSGGWLQSSPVVPGLGMPLNSRAQMFWLDEGLPTSLAPGRRPRTTLSPSIAGRDGHLLSFGTPGGDQQDQWQLIFFLRHVHGVTNLQAAIDAPLFHTGHFQASFYPHPTQPGHLMLEPSFGADVIADLRARGHDADVAEPWSVGRLTAASRAPDGLLRAAATPRLMQAYAIGR